MENQTMAEYDKLGTDDLKAKIETEEGSSSEFRTVNGFELREYIKEKFQEEVDELINAETPEEITKESAGLTILLNKYLQENHITDYALQHAIAKKIEKQKTFNTNTVIVRATLPPNGDSINDSKEIYYLKIQQRGHDSDIIIPIAAITDRAAIRKAKIIIASKENLESVSFFKKIDLI